MSNSRQHAASAAPFELYNYGFSLCADVDDSSLFPVPKSDADMTVISGYGKIIISNSLTSNGILMSQVQLCTVKSTYFKVVDFGTSNVISHERYIHKRLGRR